MGLSSKEEPEKHYKTEQILIKRKKKKGMQPDPLNYQKSWEKKREENSITCITKRRKRVEKEGRM